MRTTTAASLALTISVLTAASIGAAGEGKTVTVRKIRVLSDKASNRATSYELQNKILTIGDKKVITWLDNRQHCMVTTYHAASDTWSEHVDLGDCQDNHGGGDLAMDSKGYLYVMFGPHYDCPFKLRKSLKPHDASAWGPVETVPQSGWAVTYPCIVFDDKDTMHLVYRGCIGSSHHLKLVYMRRPIASQESNDTRPTNGRPEHRGFRFAPPDITYVNTNKDGKWSEPRTLADAAPGKNGYMSYYASLAIAKDGVIHLAYHMLALVSPAHCLYAYMCSRDGGETWEAASGERLELPVVPRPDPLPCIIKSEASADEMPGWKAGATRIGNIALDDKASPWIVYGKNLWHRSGNKIDTIDLSKFVDRDFPGKELTIVGSITFDREGMLYLVSHIRNRGELHRAPCSSQVILMTSPDYGKSFQTQLVSHENPKDPNAPNWCPNIERPFSSKMLDHVPSFIYQAGMPNNLKDQDKSLMANDPNIVCKVVFVQLVKE